MTAIPGDSIMNSLSQPKKLSKEDHSKNDPLGNLDTLIINNLAHITITLTLRAIYENDLKYLDILLRRLNVEVMNRKTSITLLNWYLEVANYYRRDEATVMIVGRWQDANPGERLLPITTWLFLEPCTSDDVLKNIIRVYRTIQFTNHAIILIAWESSDDVRVAFRRMIKLFGQQTIEVYYSLLDYIYKTQHLLDGNYNAAIRCEVVSEIKRLIHFAEMPDWISPIIRSSVSQQNPITIPIEQLFYLEKREPNPCDVALIDKKVTDSSIKTYQSRSPIKHITTEPLEVGNSLSLTPPRWSTRSSRTNSLSSSSTASNSPESLSSISSISSEGKSSPIIPSNSLLAKTKIIEDEPFDQNGSIVTIDIADKNVHTTIPRSTLLYNVPPTKEALKILIDSSDNLGEIYPKLYSEYTTMTREEKINILKPHHQLTRRISIIRDPGIAQIYGPSNPIMGSSLEDLSIDGNDKMLCAEDNIGGYSDEDDDIDDLIGREPKGYDKKSWFVGNCQACYRKIMKRCYAVRMPGIWGGWNGCYCSWSCVRDDVADGDPIQNSLITYFERYIKKNGILDRNEDLMDLRDNPPKKRVELPKLVLD